VRCAESLAHCHSVRDPAYRTERDRRDADQPADMVSNDRNAK